MDLKSIHKSIEQYASAYENLQWQQDNSGLIPQGDQKTGCIGEFYAFLYLIKNYPSSKITYAGHSNKGWDIEVDSESINLKLQVKTVSAYSATRAISPIHKGWDQLLIIYLGKDLKPLGFWQICDPLIVGDNSCLKGRKCKDPNNLNTGSKDIPFGKNRVEELKNAIFS